MCGVRIQGITTSAACCLSFGSLCFSLSEWLTGSENRFSVYNKREKYIQVLAPLHMSDVQFSLSFSSSSMVLGRLLWPFSSKNGEEIDRQSRCLIWILVRQNPVPIFIAIYTISVLVIMRCEWLGVCVCAWDILCIRTVRSTKGHSSWH